jgi:NTP pyrophosphatase (non-canonical NTP hydrolase)
MANFHSLELEVIRHAEANKLLDVTPGAYARHTIANVEELCEAIAHGDPVGEISEHMGGVAFDMIVLCALLDIDLAKCLEQAFEKISAKPEAPSNVLFLKKG